MKLPETKPSSALKLKQANVRLTDEQALALKVHCNRTGQSTQQVIIAALASVIEGFKQA